MPRVKEQSEPPPRTKIMDNLNPDAGEQASVYSKASEQAQPATGVAETSTVREVTPAQETTEYSPPCTRSQTERFVKQWNVYKDLNIAPTRSRRQRAQGRVQQREEMEQVLGDVDEKRGAMEVSISKDVNEISGQPK
ncbi:hypothetical protein MRX96_056831 [Rhipicephalus microplus]